MKRLMLLVSVLVCALGATTQEGLAQASTAEYVSRIIKTEHSGSSLFGGIFALLIIVCVTAAIAYFVREGIHHGSRSYIRPYSNRRVAGISGVSFIVLLIAVALLGGYVTVDASQVGVVVRQGKAVGTLEPGAHVVVPYVDRVVKFPTRDWTYATMSDPSRGNEDYRDFPVSMISDDGVNVAVVYTVQGRLDPHRAIEVYERFGTLENAIAQAVKFPARVIVRQSLQKFKADYLYKGIDEVETSVYQQLMPKMSDAGLIMGLFGFRKPTLGIGGDYETQINAAQVATKQALTAEEQVKVKDAEAKQRAAVAEGEKQAAIKAAEGQAKQITLEAEAQAGAIEVVKAALAQSPEYLEYMRVTAWQAGGSQVPTTVVGSDAVPWLRLNAAAN